MTMTVSNTATKFDWSVFAATLVAESQNAPHGSVSIGEVQQYNENTFYRVLFCSNLGPSSFRSYDAVYLTDSNGEPLEVHEGMPECLGYGHDKKVLKEGVDRICYMTGESLD
jgi:hypothetical protein